MRLSIFIKILVALIIVSIIPVVISNFLIIKTYQQVIDAYLPPEIIGEPAEKEIALTSETVKIQARLTIFLVLVLVLFISVLISRNLAQPLKKLITGTKAISAGQFDVKIDVDTKDEIEELSYFFNQMAIDLKKSQEAIKESNELLEAKVNSRTNELKELTRTLKDRVKEKTKELLLRVEELEKFHKLAVGRELKMIELKKEIERLK